ncbi:Mss4-like protein [Nemania sp. FL0916]|nr:Mss4-like protein [Nemania sp. FL0916]
MGTTANKQQSLTVRCQCGGVAFSTATATPLTMYHCHCTDCQKQSGSAFGTSAIFPAEGMLPLPADVEARTKKFTRITDSGNTMDCYFCADCGCRLFHRIMKGPHGEGGPRPTVSVKGGCVEGLDWTGAKHIFVRSAVLKIPDGWETYEAMPPVL